MLYRYYVINLTYDYIRQPACHPPPMHEQSSKDILLTKQTLRHHMIHVTFHAMRN